MHAYVSPTCGVCDGVEVIYQLSSVFVHGGSNCRSACRHERVYPD